MSWILWKDSRLNAIQPHSEEFCMIRWRVSFCLVFMGHNRKFSVFWMAAEVNTILLLCNHHKYLKRIKAEWNYANRARTRQTAENFLALSFMLPWNHGAPPSYPRISWNIMNYDSFPSDKVSNYSERNKRPTEHKLLAFPRGSVFGSCLWWPAGKLALYFACTWWK